MTAHEHRAEAEALLAHAAGEADNDALHERLTAIAHALLAGPPTTELEPAELRSTASLGWSGAFVLLLIAAVILGVAYMATR